MVEEELADIIGNSEKRSHSFGKQGTKRRGSTPNVYNGLGGDLGAKLMGQNHNNLAVVDEESDQPIIDLQNNPNRKAINFELPKLDKQVLEMLELEQHEDIQSKIYSI